MAKQKQETGNHPKPFSKERTKAVVSKIIYLYSLFFVVLKVIVVFKGAAFLPHFLIALPFLIFAIAGIYFERINRYSWVYVVLGLVVVSAVRYYELDLLQYFQEAL